MICNRLSTLRALFALPVFSLPTWIGYFPWYPDICCLEEPPALFDVRVKDWNDLTERTKGSVHINFADEIIMKH